MEREYRRYLALHITYPDEEIVPCATVGAVDFSALSGPVRRGSAGLSGSGGIRVAPAEPRQPDRRRGIAEVEADQAERE
jgi:hypothetical protein